ncbi:hypothetical protein [Bradyrhizobium lablabi]|uniref:hypothetical protein n=1 Tax=Bradyrhizobium lablabi TaxID=722472 RepID=UPI000AEA4C08|nr:hypothetical protein [Bradyrhizobium lablabi]
MALTEARAFMRRRKVQRQGQAAEMILVRHMVADAGGERQFFGVTLADLDINVRIVPSHRLDARGLPAFN